MLCQGGANFAKFFGTVRVKFPTKIVRYPLPLILPNFFGTESFHKLEWYPNDFFGTVRRIFDKEIDILFVHTIFFTKRELVKSSRYPSYGTRTRLSKQNNQIFCDTPPDFIKRQFSSEKKTNIAFFRSALQYHNVSQTHQILSAL